MVHWDIVKSTVASTFTGHTDSILCLHVGQRFVASGSMDGLIKVLMYLVFSILCNCMEAISPTDLGRSISICGDDVVRPQLPSVVSESN